MRLLLISAVILPLFFVSQAALAQSVDSPSSESSSNPERLVYVMPNNRTVEHKESFTPISAGTKLRLGAEDAFDPYCFVAAGLNAGVEQAANDHPQYGQGIAGFGKRYGADFTDEAVSELLGGGVFPILFRQDPRYFRMANGGIWKRSMYALSRSVKTKADSGASQFNFSTVLGDYVGAGISNAYYPSADRTFRQTMQQGSITLLEDTAFNLVREFWPDVHERLRRKRPNP